MWQLVKRCRIISMSNEDQHYSWSLPIRKKIKICNYKLDSSFDVLLRDKIHIHVYSKNFDCFYSDDADNSLQQLLNHIDIPATTG